MRMLMLGIVCLGLAGCGVELLTTTAIVGELQKEQLEATRGAVQNAGEGMAKINIQRAIDTYRAEKGANPPSLDALVPEWLPSLPKRPDGTAFAYDPATGKVLDRPASGGVTAADRAQMDRIQQAIKAYGMRTGFYPPSLEALVPQYLADVPKTESGQDFLYDMRTGALAHPEAAGTPAAAAAQSPRTGTGLSPMGEAMTGLGMQQQLGNMSNAGASSAGSHAGQKVGNVTAGHNQRQEEALQQLGL